MYLRFFTINNIPLFFSLLTLVSNNAPPPLVGFSMSFCCAWDSVCCVFFFWDWFALLWRSVRFLLCLRHESVRRCIIRPTFHIYRHTACCLLWLHIMAKGLPCTIMALRERTHDFYAFWHLRKWPIPSIYSALWSFHRSEAGCFNTATKQMIRRGASNSYYNRIMEN